MSSDRHPPSEPRRWPLLGHLPFLAFSILKARGNFAEAVRRMVRAYGRRTLRLQVGSRAVVISADPEFARRVLVERAAHFSKTRWEKRVLEPTMEGGLIILEGNEWKEHRAAIAPCFSASLMDELGTIVSDAARSRLRRWQGEIHVGHEFRCIAGDALTRFFLRGHRLKDGDGSLDRYARTYARLEEGLEDRVFDPPSLVDRVRAAVRGQESFSHAVAWITRIIEEQVSRAAAEPSAEKTALDLLLDRLPEHAVCREIRTLTAAGATTVHLLTWLCQLLGAHPEIQSRLRREIQQSVGEDPDLVSRLERCSYLVAVIHEALRLYPPAPYLLRQASPTLDAESNDDLLTPSSLVLISIWAMHRHPDFWDSPDEFLPERWLESSKRSPQSFEAFMPFGMGPRVCIGKRFALIEAMIILSEIVRRFEIRAAQAKPPWPKLTILTRPKREVVMRVEQNHSMMSTAAGNFGL